MTMYYELKCKEFGNKPVIQYKINTDVIGKETRE